MGFRASAFVVAVALVAATACDDTTGGSGTSKQISVGDNFFSPDSVDITVGDTVFWIWQGGSAHNVYSANQAVLWCGLQTTGVCYQKFASAGSFSYYCVPHVGNGMTGIVVVH